MSARRRNDGMITLDLPALSGYEMDVPEGLESAIGQHVVIFGAQ